MSKTKADYILELEHSQEECAELRRIRNRLQKDIDQLKSEIVSLQTYLADTKQDLLKTILERDEWRIKCWAKVEEHKKAVESLNAELSNTRGELTAALEDFERMHQNEQRLEAALSMFTDRRPQLHFRDDEKEPPRYPEADF